MRARLDFGGSQMRQAENLITVARVLAANGQMPKDDEIRGRLIRFGESGEEVPQDPELKCLALLALAEVSLRQNDPVDASAWLKRVTERRKTVDPSQLSRDLSARQLLLSGLISTALGEHRRGLAQLEEAQRESAQIWGPEHPWTLLISTDAVESWRALGEQDRAKAIVGHALPVLVQRLGATTPVVRDVMNLGRVTAANRASRGRSNERVVFFN
jgi:hypothetical protein